MNQVSVTRIARTAIDDATVLFVDVAIGFGQKSDTIIYLEGQKFTEFEDSMDGIALGKSSTLKQKKIVIQTTVWDIQKATNQTSVDLNFSGLLQELKIPMSLTVPEEGDVVSYTANIQVI